MHRKNKVISRQNSLIHPIVKNPFLHRLELKWYDKLKIAVMAVTVFPIRVLLVAILLLLCWPCAFIAVWGRRDEDKLEPLTGWRRSMRHPLIFLGRACFFVMGFHWVCVRGSRSSCEEAPLLVIGPHSTCLDAIICFVCGLPSNVARAEGNATPLFRTLIEVTQPVFVSRDDSNSRVSTIKEIRRRATSDGKWPQIAIFPEGTCTNRSCLISFKPGAFYPGVPVQPVLIRYQNRLDTVTWTWDGLDV
ncbi:PREDICTED: lysophosphatidylcholine acyltransferase 2-like [Priapulus caudatus]|uniref:Lysophosphatidylcholine acyltransferase 2-like n=1 Tax=Priapulus caudatus TaxID=37621 RepID=A0ABM1E9U1_PRICU|nr:PREDICTED: lysophosphatidylcholine acyltransferase 2-like [Priapulus caudatus]